jgi:hypothetical protein
MTRASTTFEGAVVARLVLTGVGQRFVACSSLSNLLGAMLGITARSCWALGSL